MNPPFKLTLTTSIYRDSLSDFEDFSLPIAALDKTDPMGRVCPMGSLGPRMSIGDNNEVNQR